MNPSDRVLFLKYALPCARTLVKRGALPLEEVEDLVRRVSAGEAVVGNPENYFKVAIAHCRLLARKAEKDIDAEVIRQYFLREHDAAVDGRYELMGDFDPDLCRTYPGRVLKVGKHALVRTSAGEGEFRKDFVPEIAEGNYVVVHWDFIVERVSQATAREMLERKSLPGDFLEREVGRK